MIAVLDSEKEIGSFQNDQIDQQKANTNVGFWDKREVKIAVVVGTAALVSIVAAAVFLGLFFIPAGHFVAGALLLAFSKFGIGAVATKILLPTAFAVLPTVTAALVARAAPQQIIVPLNLDEYEGAQKRSDTEMSRVEYNHKLIFEGKEFVSDATNINPITTLSNEGLINSEEALWLYRIAGQSLFGNGTVLLQPMINLPDMENIMIKSHRFLSNEKRESIVFTVEKKDGFIRISASENFDIVDYDNIENDQPKKIGSLTLLSEANSKKGGTFSVTITKADVTESEYSWVASKIANI